MHVLDVVRIVLAECFQNANLGLGRFLVLVDGSAIMRAKSATVRACFDPLVKGKSSSHDLDRVLSPILQVFSLDDLSKRALPQLLLDSICETHGRKRLLQKVEREGGTYMTAPCCRRAPRCRGAR